MLRPLLGRKSRRAVPSTRHVSHPNRTIEQRLGAFSGPTSLLGIESFKPLIVRLALSGASPHQCRSRSFPALSAFSEGVSVTNDR
jgi:hypothetical protein